MRATGESLRRLTDEERASIVAERVRIVNAGAGETLAELCQRSDDILGVALTAALNGLDEDAILAAGMPVKIVRAESYFGN